MDEPTLLGQIIGYLMDPLEELPNNPKEYEADLGLAFQYGLAFGLLRRELAERVMEELTNQQAEAEKPLIDLLSTAEGGPTLPLSTLDDRVQGDLTHIMAELETLINQQLNE